jgi:hypothetical protein
MRLPRTCWRDFHISLIEWSTCWRAWRIGNQRRFVNYLYLDTSIELKLVDCDVWYLLRLYVGVGISSQWISNLCRTAGAISLATADQYRAAGVPTPTQYHYDCLIEGIFCLCLRSLINLAVHHYRCDGRGDEMISHQDLTCMNIAIAKAY